MNHRPTNKGLQSLLVEDHSRIEACLDKVIDALRADDGESSAGLWEVAETSILRHFNLEDMFVFPLIEASHADEVALLRADHVAMKRDLAEVALACDLHTVRCEAVEHLSGRLREHARREEALASIEAERRARPGAAQSVFDRLKRALGLHPETVGMVEGGV